MGKQKHNVQKPTCDRLPLEARISKSNLLRRRLHSPCLFQGGSLKSNSNGVKSIAEPGLPHKLDEIKTLPN